MYKAYYYPTSNEYFFEFRPKKADLKKALLDDDYYEGDIEIKEFEVSKIKIIKNNPEDQLSKRSHRRGASSS